MVIIHTNSLVCNHKPIQKYLCKCWVSSNNVLDNLPVTPTRLNKLCVQGDADEEPASGVRILVGTENDGERVVVPAAAPGPGRARPQGSSPTRSLASRTAGPPTARRAG